jgi:hypothetical protein
MRVVASDTDTAWTGNPTASLNRSSPPSRRAGTAGLSVAHGIMQTHSGAIVAHSEPGKGSQFELYFPRATEVVALDAAGNAAPTRDGRASTSSTSTTTKRRCFDQADDGTLGLPCKRLP